MAELLAFLEDRSSWEAPDEYLASKFEEIPELDASRLPPGGSEIRSLGWSFKYEGQEIEAWLATGGWGISVDGSSKAGILLVVWFRSIVPAENVVRISDSMYSFDKVLMADESVEELQEWYEENVGELY